MAILAFQRPEKVIMLDANDFQGTFEFRPLEPGFGITIGNALRRILLSSLEGYAISCIKIDGVDHEFATIPGVMDDVTNIILNLKQVRFKRVVESTEEETLKFTISNKEQLTAGDLNEFTSDFKILNPDLVICHMDSSASVTMELTITHGRGFVAAEANDDVEDKIGIIPIDAIYTPIVNVKYTAEPYRVEQRVDYEKLVLEIKTDGSIHPKEALKEAASILIQHFALFSDKAIALEQKEGKDEDEFNEEVLHMRQLLKTKLTDLDLSVRALNCLKAADVETLGDLCKINRAELLKFRNFGKKSLTELDDKLESMNLSFGMDLSIYKLEKE